MSCHPERSDRAAAPGDGARAGERSAVSSAARNVGNPSNFSFARRVELSGMLLTAIMQRPIHLAILLLASCSLCLAQDPAISPERPLSVNPPERQSQPQDNSSSATKDNSATSGDQITKPAGMKGSTLIGCLAGPDKDGKFVVHNMAHRAGVQVVGPEDLKNDSGSKVKLIGEWQSLPPDQMPATPAQPSGKSDQPERKPETRRFQATDVEVVAQKCTPPTETTPVSKNKAQKPTTYNAPGSDDSK